MATTTTIIKTILALLLTTASLADAFCPALIWSDEFNGNELNPDNWSHQLGDGCSNGVCGWGNNELQQYRAENTQVSGGFLTITADKEKFRGRTTYTSSRMTSMGLQSFDYGFFEARIKLPTASQGIWPAFWMLGDNYPIVGWPACGELDIMENIGREPRTIHGTMHYGPPAQNSGASYSLLGTDKFADDFHVFAIEKFPNQVRWLVDGVVYFTREPDDLSSAAWPFEQPFHFLLNVAIGGNWPGNPDGSTIFPATMQVDYVRVYDAPYGDLIGPDFVPSGATGVTYQVQAGLSSYTYQWSLPAGVTITSGDGTDTITVSFGSASGTSTVSVTATSTTCTDVRTFQMPITIDSSTKGFSFVSAGDDTSEVGTMVFNTGSAYDGSHVNPTMGTSDPVNDSSRVVRYQRNSAELYDVLIYSTNDAIPDPSVYVSGDSNFKMDVYTNAPPGTVILLQMENAAQTGNAYPAGRHSRFEAVVGDGASAGWQRLDFRFKDRPDTSETVVNQLTLLLNPNSYTSNVYYLDNLDSYSDGDGGPVDPPTQSPVNDGGGGGTCTKLPAGDGCTSDDECCSEKCKGRPGQKTCG